MLAELALDDWSRGGLADAPPLARALVRAGPGLRVAQVVLQGRIDAGLRAAGAGDGGGLATLVVHLSKALGRQAEIDHVVTVTRAFADEHAEASHELPCEPIDERSTIHRVAFGPDRYLATAEMWPHRREAERALELTLRRLLPLDVVHLRFADVGTFAAARVCKRLGIPVCFTLAADPHVVIRNAERSGTLSRETFAEADARDHFLFRAHLVETMLGQADGLVAFPRQEGESDLNELLGIDRSRRSARGIRTVAEGVSLRTLDGAARRNWGGAGRLARPPGRSQRLAACAGRPSAGRLGGAVPSRQGLPPPARGVGGRPRALRRIQPRHRRREHRASHGRGTRRARGHARGRATPPVGAGRAALARAPLPRRGGGAPARGALGRARRRRGERRVRLRERQGGVRTRAAGSAGGWASRRRTANRRSGDLCRGRSRQGCWSTRPRSATSAAA